MVFLSGFRKLITCVVVLVVAASVGSTAQQEAAVVLQDTPEVLGAPPVPPGAVRLVNFVWHERRVAICAEEPGPPIERGNRQVARTRVWVRDGNITKQLSTDLGSCDPAWSPDGTKLAVVDLDGLWVLSSNLLQTTHLFDARDRDTPIGQFIDRTLAGPLWSPDGTAIALHVSNVTTGWVEVVDARTGGILFSSEPEIYDFAWNSDSKSLRFGSRIVRIPEVQD